MAQIYLLILMKRNAGSTYQLWAFIFQCFCYVSIVTEHCILILKQNHIIVITFQYQIQYMLHNSTFKQIDKQTFAKFKKVRDMTTPIFGTYSLRCKQNIKYFVKSLPSYAQFTSYRSRHTNIYKYTQSSNKSYIYPLLGQSMFQMTKYFNPLGAQKNKISSKQFQYWYQKNNGSLQSCLKQILSVLLKAIQDGVKQILLECLRVYNGQVLYCYQSWMASPFQIMQTSPTQIENYFFSQEDLQQLQVCKQSQTNSECHDNSLSSLFFRSFLLVLSIGSNSLKIRNYQYGKFCINRQNLSRRVEYFKMNYNNKKLADFVQRIINGEQILMEQLLKLTNQTTSNLLTSICSQSHHVLTQMNHNINTQSKIFRQSNSTKSLNFNNTFNSRLSLNTKPSISKLSVLSKQNKQNLHQSTTVKQNIGKQSFISVKSKQSQTGNYKAQVRVKLKDNNKKYDFKNQKSVIICETSFNLKEELSRQEQNSFCGNIKILKYLGLQQYLPKCAYQKNILQYLDNLHIKDNFTKINYSNDSLYFGQLNTKNQRHGTGLYMFSSNDVYFGEWFKNQMSGEGRYIFRSGQVYVGTVKNGNKNGYGKFMYADGKVYEGYWNKNQKCGLSIMNFPNNVKFYGQFHSNQQLIEGVFVGADQNQNAIWKQNAFLNAYDHIKNKFKYQIQQNCTDNKKLLKIPTSYFVKKQDNQGKNFIGSMKCNIKSGYGVEQSQKCLYKGLFKNDLKNGQGQLINKQQGFTIKGEWNQGMLVHYSLQ